jgi:uncharacterized tellurite resistance protein B-like protein
LAAMTVMGPTGTFEDEELSALQRMIRGDNDAFNQAWEAYKRLNVSDCIPLVTKALNEAQRLSTLANLLDIAMADGVMEPAEEQILGKYLEAFSVPEAKVKPLVDFIAIKNDISVFEK